MIDGIFDLVTKMLKKFRKNNLNAKDSDTIFKYDYFPKINTIYRDKVFEYDSNVRDHFNADLVNWLYPSTKKSSPQICTHYITTRLGSPKQEDELISILTEEHYSPWFSKAGGRANIDLSGT